MNAMTRFRPLRIVLAAAAISAAATHAPAQTAPDANPAAPLLEDRLNRLCEQLESQRQSLHIPGMAIAIVKDDQIILARGFGQRDIELDLPATKDTLFAIGSSSKAFTSTLIGMLVDEGVMRWDDPVRKHLPQFHLKDPAADEKTAIRDLLCHRTGLTRTDLAWASGEATRDEILQAIAAAEPVTPFREAFHYNNVMFLAAGEAAAHAAKTDWDALVRDRIFRPLGMSSTTTDFAKANGDPLLSKGYVWDGDKAAFKRLPMRDLHNIAPAGAINSTALDMAQWVRLQLGRGEIDGKRLVSSAAVDETWTKQITMAGDIDYGLGWMLHKWNGRRVVEHGGNIDGFGAEVALLPDERIGYALLTNVTATPLQSLSVNLVFDALLGEWNPSAQPLDLAAVRPYLGKYHFDVLKTDVTVLVRNGKLAVDVPGQMVFELKPPDKDGKWAFDFPTPISVSFVTGEEGKARMMKLYQSGLEFELPREGVTLPPEIDAQEAAKYLGVYHLSQPRSEDWTVLVRNGRLAIDVPKQTVYELRPPDKDGKRACRIAPGIAVRFNADDSGKIVSLTQFQGGLEILLPRTGEAAASEPLPTLDDLIALQMQGSGAAHLDSLDGVRLTGAIDFVNQGVTGSIVETCQGPDRFIQRIDLGRFGHIAAAIDRDRAWSESSFAPSEELTGSQRAETRLQNPLTLAADWRKTFDKIEVVRSDVVKDRPAYVVDLKTANGTALTAWVDKETGRPARLDASTTIKGIGSIQNTIRLEDYRDVNGVMLPFLITSETEASGKTVVRFDKAETNAAITDDTFKPGPGAADHAK